MVLAVWVSDAVAGVSYREDNEESGAVHVVDEAVL